MSDVRWLAATLPAIFPIIALAYWVRFDASIWSSFL